MTTVFQDEEFSAEQLSDHLHDAREIRAVARERRKTITTGDQLYRLYLAFILICPPGYLLVGALQDTTRAGDPQVLALLGRTSVVAPILLVALGLAALRLASWTGPVVVARADVAWLFSLPFTRDQLVRPRLSRALAVAGVIGAIGGVLLTIPYHLVVGLAPDSAAEAARMAASGATAGALYLLILACAGWLVEINPKAARALMRGGGILIVLLVGLAVAAMLSPVPPPWFGRAVLASGPWGWGVAMVLASTSPVGLPPLIGAVALVVLLLLAVALVRTALRRAGDVPLEELRRRAATSAQVTAAAVYFADFRSAAQARDRVVRALVGRSRRRLPMPRHRLLLTPWIGSTILLRQPRRMAQALLWLVGAVALFARGIQALPVSLEQGPSPFLAFIPLAGAIAYPAAGTLVEPLRVELEQRFSLRMRPDGLLTVGIAHLVAPAVALWLEGVLAILIIWGISGLGALNTALIPTAALGGAVLLMALASPALILAAAFVASGPPADSTWLYSGDAGLGRLLFHLLRGPILAAVIVGVGVLVAGGASVEETTLAAALLSSAAWSIALGVGLGRWVQSRLISHQQ